MGKYEGISVSDLELLSKYDTPTICNVIELFDIRPRDKGYMDHRIKACFPQMPPMVGYASTATFRSASPPKSGDIYSSMSDQVESFAELPGPAVVATRRCMPVLTRSDLAVSYRSARWGPTRLTSGPPAACVKWSPRQ